MISHSSDDRLSTLDTLTRQALRRRPRYGIEGQPGRCPICNRLMMLYMSLHGPAYHCGCKPGNGMNGNGTSLSHGGGSATIE
jgi:hypothetical protein